MIDSVKKSLDDKSYLQRITPRRARSNWSKKNTEHVEKLIAVSRMQPAGLVQVNAAKIDGRWEKAYSQATEMKVPDDFLAELKHRSAEKKFFETLNKSNLYAIAYELVTAKKPETSEKRFLKYMNMLVKKEKPNFGFKIKEK